MEERLHAPTGHLLEAASDGRGDEEDLPGLRAVATHLEAKHGQEHGAGAVQRAEGPPHEADAVLREARGDEHPGLLEQQAAHAPEEKDDDDLIPAEMHVVEVLVDGLVGGLPAGEHTGEAALLARAGHLAVEGVVGLDHRADGGLEVLLVDAAATLEPLGEVDDHTDEAAHDLDEKDEQK